MLFCLAFGPALVRALARYRTRFEVHWVPVAATGLLLAVVVGSAAPPAADASQADAAAADRSEQYLLRAQNDDGGWGGTPGQPSSQLYSGWAALGVAAAGRNPRDAGSPNAVAYIRAHARELNDLGELNRTILVLRAAGLPPRIGGRNLERAVLDRQRRGGSFAGRVNTTAFAILGLRAAGRPRGDRAVQRAADWIAGQVNDDGGFNFAGRGGPSGIDDTGAALQALAAAGWRGRDVVRRAARFVVRNQASDGGFALIPGGPSNAQSTAWAVQGLLAAGREPSRVRRNGSRDPMSYLRSLTAANGEVRYSRSSRQTPGLGHRPGGRRARPQDAAAQAGAPSAGGCCLDDERRAERHGDRDRHRDTRRRAAPASALPEIAKASPRRSALAAASQIPAAGALVSALM